MCDFKKFPLWKPHFRTEERFWGTSKDAFNALRNSSSAFIKRKDVRFIILSKCGNKCAYCGDKNDLQVDHIISVYQAFKVKCLICKLNTYDNLQILCKVCNSRKRPKEG